MERGGPRREGPESGTANIGLVPELPISGVTTREKVAVTPHHLATRAALDVMAGGGNAVDGAIAANAVLGVVFPTTCGVGGDLFALVHGSGVEVPSALNASGRGGRGLDASVLRAEGHVTMPVRTPAAITTPGCVDGWIALLERHGSLTLADVLAPAIAHAENGFAVSPELADALAEIFDLVRDQPSAFELYPEDRPPAPGEHLHRPRYASTLRRIADQGRDGFYGGPVAEAIVAACEDVLAHSDLQNNRADWIDPIGLDLFGQRAWTIPPNSQGYLTLATGWLFSALNPPRDPSDPRFHHAAIEAYRAMAWERDDIVADAAYAPVAAAELLTGDRLKPRLDAIDRDHATQWPSAAAGLRGTAYFCVMDDAGRGVSLIQSNYAGIGSGISAGNTGVWLHNRGACFSIVENHPNEAGRGKRPLHTLAPTLWTRDGRLSLLLGTQGGDQQPQYLSQMAALMLHAGLSPMDAQRFPRWHIETPSRLTHSSVHVEEGMSPDIVAGLVERGHEVRLVPDRQPYWGPLSVIVVEDDGTRQAVADPRVSTATAAT
jgi:gamma-glutamyltranspeptidase/glutathione hydrolase